jgi:hypothetical protein
VSRAVKTPPVPAGTGYTLERPDRLLVNPGVQSPPATDWFPLWKWGDGALVFAPAFPATAKRPCRWILDCDSPGAVVTIPHKKYGNIDACTTHALDYLNGSSSLSSLNGTEAEPACWCPDGAKPDTRMRVDYCPAHGRGRSRGRTGDLDP